MNKDNMLDYEGCMVEQNYRVRALMSDVQDNSMMEVSAVISEAEWSLTNDVATKFTVSADLFIETLETCCITMGARVDLTCQHALPIT